jgi:hypothetical protein
MKAPTSNVKDLRDRADLDEAIEIINDALSAEPTAASPNVRNRLLGRMAMVIASPCAGSTRPMPCARAAPASRSAWR